jgi:hypothetical protein
VFLFLLNIRSPEPSTSQTNILETQENSIFDADTDIDSDLDVPSDILTDKSNVPLPFLNNVFHNYSFYLSSSLKHSLKKECYRYIIALDG